MEEQRFIEEWIAHPRLEDLTHAVLRQGAHVPEFRSALSGLSLSPLQRFLVGLDNSFREENRTDSLALLCALVSMERRVNPIISLPQNQPTSSIVQKPERNDELSLDRCHQYLSSLKGDPEYWIPAARLLAQVSPEEENRLLRLLSQQQLPFVLPGNLSPHHVAIFAVGDRLLSVLHTDWVRKLSQFQLPMLEMDCACFGGWFLPLLGLLPHRDVVRALRGLNFKTKSKGAGMAAYYACRLGEEPMRFLDQATPAGELYYALAISRMHMESS